MGCASAIFSGAFSGSDSGSGVALGTGLGCPAFSSIVPSTSPTLTSPPSGTLICCRTPAPFAPTSTLTLSVSSSTSTSPTLTESPSFLSQWETVASKTDSPNSGTVISIAILTSLLHDTRGLGLLVKIEGLLDQRLLVDSIQRCGPLRRAGAFRPADIMKCHPILHEET